jgi:VanZ family protein
VLILICLPKQEMPEIEPMWWFSIIRPDKVVHAVMFGMLNYLFIFPIFKSEMVESTKVNYFIWISLAASVWGLSTEFIQLLVPGRSFDLLDWLADSIGVLMALIYIYWKFKQNRNNQHP